MRDEIYCTHAVGNIAVVISQLVHRLRQIRRNISKYFYFMYFPISFKSFSTHIRQLKSCDGNQLLERKESICWKLEVDTRYMNDELDPVNHSPQLGQARLHKGLHNY
jgi:hypothetical protein